MRNIISYFIKYPIAANMLMVGIFILGVFGLINMKSTFFPEVESRMITIQTVYPGASPEEIEEGIVLKIEENLKGITGIERVTSVSRENSGTVNVEVLKGYNTDVILQDVKNAVDQINSFPASMEPPTIFKQENLGFAISFSISGNVDLETLKTYSRKVEDDLRAIDGISKVALSGFPEEEIEIAFREQDLRAYQLTFAQATRAVQVANLEITGGTVKGEKEELLVRARNKKYYADELRNIVVKNSPSGGVIRLYQIADINDKWEDSPNRSFLNGEPSVVVTVQNTLEEDILGITEKVRNYISDYNEVNEVVKATIIRDQSIVLNQRIELLRNNGIAGFLIVTLMLAMFLNWRLALWVALAIPISFAGMFACAYILDTTINVISLFGMILVIGILVDDGIVISESIYQKYEKGVPRMKAAIDGTMEVLPAVFSAILTTVIVFMGFFFIDGRIGDFFTTMAVVVIFSLIFSLVEGAFILPAHVAHSKALSPDNDKGWVTTQLDNFMLWMKNKLYAPVLRLAMRNGWATISIIVGVLIITVGAIQGGIIQQTFFPNIERDDLTVTLKMPAGTRENITFDWLTHIEKAAWEVNDQLSEQYFNNEKQAILKVEKAIGPTTYDGRLNITLLDSEARDSLRARIVSNAIRSKAGTIYGAEQVTFGGSTPFGKPVSLSLVSNNFEQLALAADKVKAELENLEELKDVVDNNQEGLREINLSLKEKAHYLGLNLQEIVAQVRQGFFGSEIQRLQRGRDEVRVWVRYKEEERSNIGQLENMRIRFADGREFPLSEIANLEIKRGVIAINHLEGKKEITVEADIAEDDVSSSDMNTSIQEDIVPEILQDYPAVQALYEGQNRENAKTAKSMQLVVPVVLLFMFFTIALTFRSVSQTIIVFALIPFALIGVGWGHWYMGHAISLFSNLGIFALIGILVNDALVFITTYNNFIKDDVPVRDAIFNAGLSRFRPIVLTSLTTMAGLAPLMFNKSFQAQFLIPMAISVAFGLMVITVIILVLLPTLLMLSNRIKVFSIGLWEGKVPALELVEPANENRRTNYPLWIFAVFYALVIGAGLLFGIFKVVSFIS